MRTIETYILRLLLDTKDPHILRGAIRSVADGQEQTFADGQALLALLGRMNNPARRAEGKEDPRST